MSEKKACKINDEVMKNITGGQGDNEIKYNNNMSIPDLSQKKEDTNIVHLTCPECGESIGISTYKSKDFSSTITGVCPCCKKDFSITV